MRDQKMEEKPAPDMKRVERVTTIFLAVAALGFAACMAMVYQQEHKASQKEKAPDTSSKSEKSALPVHAPVLK